MTTFDVISGGMSAAFSLLVLVGIVVAIRHHQKDRVPPELWHAPAPAGLVRVTGEVLGGNPFSPHWRIRYPLPDGSDGELRAVATRPQVLRAGMLVPVLVDPHQPTRARLDVPAHAAVVSIVKTVWIILGGVAAGCAVVAVVLVVVL